jgi:LuxR family transcriptional regulator, maltose regulon positive regulatory protein
VILVSAPAGSGKTVLLRSWMEGTGLTHRAAWVQASRDEQDPQRLWLTVLDALRRTDAGSALVRPLTAAPDLDGWTIAERLLKDLAPMRDPLWLVLDDVHELGSDQARRQLELLIMRSPSQFRFVLATRQDVRLGLHRLRLEGELTELRVNDLRFNQAEAGMLFEAAGVSLPIPTLAALVDRTEGWAAGLRLAALSLAGHPAPERFAAEFSGSERTVAEYLLAEVLGRQTPEVRRLLLRTSVLQRVNGDLADLLTGSSGGERVLQDLEEANAFVVSVDAARSWFRYHHLFGELLDLELRRLEPDQVTALHQAASGWFAEHGHPVDAIQHAQAAQNWGLASRLMADHWPELYLDGRTLTVHRLMAEFPAEMVAADAGLAAVAAADGMAQGSLSAAKRYLGLAQRQAAGVPEARRGQIQVLLAVVGLLTAGRDSSQAARDDKAQGLLAAAEALGPGQRPLEDDLRSLALVELGNSETWVGRLGEAWAHLAQALTLARRIGRPYLELLALVYQGEVELSRRFPEAEELGRRAVYLAERNGWPDDLFAGFAAMTLGSALAWQGRLREAEPWIQRSERIFAMEASPAGGGGDYVRGQFELARGHVAASLEAFRACQRRIGPHPLARPLQAWLLHAMVDHGHRQEAHQMIAELSERDRHRPDILIATAVLQLAWDDPSAASAALVPVLDGTIRVGWQSWLIEAFLIEAIAQDALGDLAAAARALERALDLAEADGALLWFLMHPAPALLDRHARRGTAHRSLLDRIRDLLSGNQAPSASPEHSPLPPLSDREVRVLRYLPTHLSAPEIAADLSVATSTVKTHMRSLYAKLGAHSRAEAVETARARGLLAPSGRR